jgi:triacylglycerol lipase
MSEDFKRETNQMEVYSTNQQSSTWGADFKYLTVEGKRGISHGDVIDLNRENIPGFDVREFYVKLVHDLKTKGY